MNIKNDLNNRISTLATKSGHKKWIIIDENLLQGEVANALKNPRKREIHIFHTGDMDNLQRMLNALQPGSYIRPHVHSNPPKAESLIILKGVVGFVSFNNNGETKEKNFLLLDRTRGFYGIDYRAGLWHTFFALEPDSIIFEVKAGPYNSNTDKVFPSWAPEEGSENSIIFLKKLEDSFRVYWKLPLRTWQ